MNIRRLIPDRWKQEFKIRLGAPQMYWSINNMKRNGFHPKTILDVGAFHGEWTTEVKKIFPESHFFMVEANPHKREILGSVCAKLKNTDFTIALLASESNVEKVFNVFEYSVA